MTLFFTICFLSSFNSFFSLGASLFESSVKSLRWLFSSVQFSCSVMSESLPFHGLQHGASLSITNSWSLLKLMSVKLVRPSNHLILCHPLLLLPQSFPASESFPLSQFFASGGQTIGVSASASVLPMHIQDWFPLGLTGWISLQSKGLSRVFSNTTVQKHLNFPQTKAFLSGLLFLIVSDSSLVVTICQTSFWTHYTYNTLNLYIHPKREALSVSLFFKGRNWSSGNSLAQCHRASNWKCQETGLNRCFEALFSAFPSFSSEWRAPKNWFKLVSGEGHGAKSEYHYITLGLP